MTRNMTCSNQRIFALLDSYCAGQSDPIRNSGTPRWISTTDDEKDILKRLKLKERLDCSPYRKLGRFEYKKKSFFCTVGLADACLNASDGFEVDVHAGLLTAALSDLQPAVRASSAQVRDIVEIGNMGVTDYRGHQAASIASLFPSTRMFEVDDLDPAESWRLFFMLCLAECLAGESWLNSLLGGELEALGDLGPNALPYVTLCRSIFDTDPAAMFLALYRCLEAIYAYSSATRVRGALQLEQSWSQIAVVLEDALGWHPHEEGSLTSLMKEATEVDLNAIIAALGEEPGGTDLPGTVARRVYKLRNNLVHYRPVQHSIDNSQIDWNSLCAALASVVCFTYHKVFESSS